MSRLDLLVVGAGPGGSATAITAASQGLRVCLLDAAGFPRARPGETLHPGVEPVLDQLQVAEAVTACGFPRHAGQWISWGGPLHFERFGADAAGPWHGMQARREEFDSRLLERAAAAGADVVQPCRATAALREQGQAVGVDTTRGPIRARYVVDAAGSQRFLGRQLGLRLQRYSRPLIVRYGYVEGSCPVRDDAPALVADSGGWTWTARVGADLYTWTRLCLPGRHVPADWLPEEFHGLRQQRATRGADVTWRSTRETAGPGYFLVGDAAAVFDPASSHGVLRALMTGMLAGHAIAQVIAQELSPSSAATGYRAWLGAWIAHDLQALERLYRVFRPSPALMPGAGLEPVL